VVPRITERERRILRLLLEACDNKEIAKQLNMSDRTVKAHFRRLFVKFGIDCGVKRVKLAVLMYRERSTYGLDL
jgi:DNA-binding NarL/FixJ family response regulator